MLGAQLGQRPEDEVRNFAPPLGRGLQSLLVDFVDRGIGATTALAGEKSGGSEMAHARGSLRGEMVEQLADRLPQRRGIAARTGPWPCRAACAPRLGQVEHQVVRAQAGNVQLRIEARQRIVEIVGQEDGRQPALPRAPAATSRARPSSQPPCRTSDSQFSGVTRSSRKPKNRWAISTSQLY